MFSAETEKEAEMLIVMACPRDTEGNYYARELAQEQSLENLVAFSDRLQECWDLRKDRKAMKKCKTCGHKAGHHDCLTSNPVKWKCSVPGCKCTGDPRKG